MGIAPLKIEVLTQISGVSFEEALEGARAFDLNGRAIPYIGRAALIRNKTALMWDLVFATALGLLASPFLAVYFRWIEAVDVRGLTSGEGL